MNYFEFYDIAVSFQVDESALRRIFYQNSKKYHPDFHTLANDEQQAEMLNLATLNTKAYQTLSDPDRRMRYVLEINGLLAEENKHALPQAFLMEMMDINEALMELEFDFDAERFAQAGQAVKTLENKLSQEVRPILERYSSETGTPEDLQAVLNFYLKKKYLLRIQENLSKFAPQ